LDVYTVKYGKRSKLMVALSRVKQMSFNVDSVRGADIFAWIRYAGGGYADEIVL
jgi:hypothetical protein